jgi:1-acyl-sn-glycerol-3-phosphate acyltransferase
MKPFYWFTRALIKVFVFAAYGHKVYGKEHIVQGKGILAPNHTSFLDPPLIAASWPEEVSFLARKSLFSYRLFGTLITILNAYPVNGTAQDLNSFRLIYGMLEQNKKVVIFPEGIRSSDGALTPIKSGIGMLALRSKSPIFPIYIHGCYQIWNRQRRFPKLWGKTACVIGSPIYWHSFSHLEKKEAQEAIASNVKESLEKLKTWYDNGAIGCPP